MTFKAQFGAGLMVFATITNLKPEDQPTVKKYSNPSYPTITEKPWLNEKSTILPKIKNVPKYPPPEENMGISQTFRIALIGETSETLESGEENMVSYMKMGYLRYTKNPSPNQPIIKITWDEQEHEKGMILRLAETGEINRDTGLSELTYFNGHLLTMSRYSNQIYRFTSDDTFRLHKWIAVNIQATDGAYLAWATVITDELNTTKLYVGSTGTNEKMLKVFAVLTNGGVIPSFLDFDGLKKVCSINVLGYLTHTTSLWSNKRKRCFFMPQKVSKQMYAVEYDILKGSNIILSTNSALRDPKLEKTIGVENPELGYTSAKFLPNNNEEIIVALQNSDFDNDSYITVFNFNTGEIIYTSTLVSKTEHMTYSGLEFLSM